MNEYNGYKILSTDVMINKISIHEYDEQKFFESFVSARTPVLFNNLLQDDECKIKLWNNAYLKVRIIIFIALCEDLITKMIIGKVW